VLEVRCELGSYLAEAALVLVLEPMEAGEQTTREETVADLDTIRADLQKTRDRHAWLLDENRASAVAKRHARGGRTARENIAQLCDDGSFIEYGALAIAAQTRRRSLADLIANTPADGMVTGIGTVNAAPFGKEQSRCVVMAYDYTVLAGTQGAWNHQKTDRMLALALQLNLPVVLFAEGGGGRPGDIDKPIVAGLNNHTFRQFAALSGKVPVVGIVHGRCFAGNAALLGCSDVVIATEASNIGMSGPAMIEGGGLGTYTPEQIGPSDVQSRNGVIDILVKDETEAVVAAQKYLSYFQGPAAQWECADQRLLRHAVPENRLRVYDIRALMHTLVDTDSLLELRRGYGAGIVTALARVQGRAVGIMANNPTHLGGAIDVDAADKSARFMQLCEAHGLPIVSLTDTPGFMVGPDIEAQAQVRHVCRMFVVAAHLSVPFFAVVLRKGYGLGAQAMTAGGFDTPIFTLSWPTGEFGPMGLEGAVRLGFSKELEAAAPGAERDALFAKLVAQQYANGEAIHMAQGLEIDAVIDPMETRDWLVRGLESAAAKPRCSHRCQQPFRGRLVNPSRRDAHHFPAFA
jgi:acetyl-CoA carboxylase carboxyltransferase component